LRGSYQQLLAWRFFDRHGIRFKKTRSDCRENRRDVAAARLAWADDQPKLDPDRLVFIDETGASTKMGRKRSGPTRRTAGRQISHVHWKTTSFLPGLPSIVLTAPCVIDGPTNGNAFLAYVEQASRRLSNHVTSSVGQFQRPLGSADRRSDRCRGRKTALVITTSNTSISLPWNSDQKPDPSQKQSRAAASLMSPHRANVVSATAEQQNVHTARRRRDIQLREKMILTMIPYTKSYFCDEI
jgi:hypothetical protein